MKTSLIILLVCVMPVVLFGYSLMQHQYFAQQAQSVLIQPNSPVLSQMRGMPQLPVRNVNRDRSWRLLECDYAGDINSDGQLIVTHKDVIFYNSINPACIDSIVYYSYDFETETFVTVMSRTFFYDAAGEKIIKTDWQTQGNSNNFYRKDTYDYDATDRLINESHFEWVNATNSYVRTVRADYIYDNDGLIGINQLNTDIYGETIVWYRHTYSHDTQGRIINRVVEMSQDSLNWDFFINTAKSYHPDDTSTGADYIQYLSSIYPVSLDEAYGYEDLVGMPLESIVSWWGGEVWDYIGRYVYAYNNSNLLESMTGHSYDAGWHPEYRYNYAFDNNANLQTFSSQNYDPANSVWQSIDEANTLIWGEYTGVDDEVAPGIALSLSAYPNPFRNEVSFNLMSKDNAPFDAGIYNLKGQLVKQISIQKGNSFTWDGKDAANKAVSNGIYLVKINQNGRASCSKIIRVR